MAFKAVFHYPAEEAEQQALMKRFSALKAEKALGYLCSLELPGNTVKQVVEEISKTRVHKK